ncbi:unnamed protein product [Ostreobium quekettii]|uniref:histidine kinase n=1 Tax=Ostreobium quekettii TaxID=121088 RepID=A0A8S1J7S1_9CHLO|nr:unnamed protein product [Ostreobium quekettii]
MMLSYQTDYCRRQMFAFQHLANAAQKREIEGREARRKAEGELAAIQSHVARRNQQIARKKADIEEKSELMRVMCHEVRTPLNSCLASAEMLLDTPLQDEQRDHAQTIRLSGSILLSTVSNFLDYFKLEAGRKLEIGLTEVNLPALLSQLHSIIQAMIGTNTEVDLTTPRMHNVPEVVLTDPGRLRGVILNLYTNAAKCTRRGFIDLNVSVIDRPYAVPPGPEYSNVMVTPSSLQGASNGLVGLNTSGPPSQGMSLVKKFMRDRPSVDYTAVASQPDWETDLFDGDSVKSAGSGTVWASHAEGPPSPSEIDEGGAGGIDGQRVGATWASGRVQHVVAPGAQGQQPGSNGGQEGACPEWLLFEIVDSGMGISKNELKSLFQEYVTVGMSHPKTLTGTGLGLSICSKQVDVLGGRIGAYSKLNAGSVFWFTIPLIEANRKHASIRRLGSHGGGVWRPPERTKPGTTPSPSPLVPAHRGDRKRGKSMDTSVLQGRRVLLAEDDVLSQNVTRKMLTTLGMNCTVVSNGKDAVNLLTSNGTQEAPFDVVLMDMLMPTMGGIKATQEIRKKGVRVPIIAMTANALGRDWEECRAAGMDDFLSKPVFKAPMAEALVRVSMARGRRRGAANI